MAIQSVIDRADTGACEAGAAMTYLCVTKRPRRIPGVGVVSNPDHWKNRWQMSDEIAFIAGLGTGKFAECTSGKTRLQLLLAYRKTTAERPECKLSIKREKILAAIDAAIEKEKEHGE